MKKIIAFAALSTAISAATLPVEAASKGVTELKQGTAFTTGSVVGAMVGGPIGMLIGALGGVYVAEQIKQVDEQEDLAVALAHSEQQVDILSTELSARNEMLSAQEVRMDELQELALDQLQLQVLFHTGSDVLTEQGEAQVQSLANFLTKNPELAIQLNGHADPRGTDEYNNVLSHYRAMSVQQLLEAAGVAPDRIAVSAFGAGQSKAQRGDLEAYALERRVDITIHQPKPEAMAMGH
ncbi:OmpA family protein [Simiduia sp. 21SJ11W-1]|uniref:OmpA family protein n=1 Tax=Simiduia sp. 21SJ11W-1 TaxID=2909669 RepID=UPI0020A1AEA7|nr:OmpA family protein [Simiduia sp. 21SJ11W-1]UTA49090.1 OmpA family protein [Simiduia sp. 21SJ11W-1]